MPPRTVPEFRRSFSRIPNGRIFLSVLIALSFCAPIARSQASLPKIYIAPQNGFESFLAGAFTKKGVPAVIVQTPDAADYILAPAPVVQKPESAGGKIARCAFAYCAGIEGTQTASVTLTDVKTKSVVWAYNVRKGGSDNFQSSAEACAKHLKNWLDHTGT
jgi:hypothetical protein